MDAQELTRHLQQLQQSGVIDAAPKSLKPAQPRVVEQAAKRRLPTPAAARLRHPGLGALWLPPGVRQ